MWQSDKLQPRSDSHNPLLIISHPNDARHLQYQNNDTSISIRVLHPVQRVGVWFIEFTENTDLQIRTHIYQTITKYENFSLSCTKKLKRVKGIYRISYYLKITPFETRSRLNIGSDE